MSSSHTPENIAATFCATLIDEWVHHGVRHAVVAPGSRSTPMALAVAAHNAVQVHVFHDERAAAFAALGIGLQGTPAVLLCTSGTAASHFHAAVIEAHLSAVPMIVCTADRPPELRDVGAPQTIDQTKLYGSAVRWFHDPGVAAAEASPTWRSLAAHAFGSATGLWPGPVHINLPFREPLVGTASALPDRPPSGAGSGAGSQSSTATADLEVLGEISAAFDHPRGVIVAGRAGGGSAAIRELALASGWPVLADARSGTRHLHDVVVCSADALLRSADFASSHRPDVVVRLGEPPVSKVLNQWLAGSGARQLHVTAVPTWTDPDGSIGLRLVADPTSVCRSLARLFATKPAMVVDSSWMAAWLRAELVAQAAIDAALMLDGLTEPLVARSLVAGLQPGSFLVVSSSMPIRDVEWYGGVPAGVIVHSNRGANGIDGVIATAIGVAVATRAPTTLLIGDIAFLHDGSALIGLVERGIDLRIVVVDNDGGGIFNFLPQATALTTDRFEQLFGTPHGVDLTLLASAHGLTAAAVRSVDDLRQLAGRRGPSVTVVRSERVGNVDAHTAIHEAVIQALRSAECVIDDAPGTPP